MQKILSLLLVAFISLTGNAQEAATADSLSKSVYYPECIVPAGGAGAILKSYSFEESLESIENSITALKRRRKDTASQEKLLELCEKGIQGLQGTAKVVVIDSMVISKDKLLSAYPTLSTLGKVEISDEGKKVTFTTEMGNKMYEPVGILTDEGEQSSTFKCYLIENGQKISSSILDGLEVEGELNYPFLMADGVTFYFAARNDEGYGNFDLYVTRYDSDNDKFYRAENMGYPFNSYANDYMMVIDEENELGWFASDRYQPDGMVCIYTFLYNSSRRTYDYESDDHVQIIRAASLRSIRSTWDDDSEQERIKAKQRLALNTTRKSVRNTSDFEFIINENFTYNKLSDFQSDEAREKFKQWKSMSKELTENRRQLDNMRDEYAKASLASKAKLTVPIGELELRVEKQIKDCHNLEKEIRRIENQ